MQALPVEIREIIYSYLDPYTLWNIKEVNQQFRSDIVSYFNYYKKNFLD